MPQASSIFVPATTSGVGVGLSGYVLNSVKEQSVLIDALMGNAIAIFFLSVGCFALGFGIGQYLHQQRNTKKWGPLASFSTSGGFQGVAPFVIGSVMLHNTQEFTLQSIISNYVIFMAAMGLILLAIGAFVIHTS